MATRSGRCSTMIAARQSKMVDKRADIGSRGESLTAPQVRHVNLPSWQSSTTPYPVYSVPQSIPRTRILQSLASGGRDFVYSCWFAPAGSLLIEQIGTVELLALEKDDGDAFDRSNVLKRVAVDQQQIGIVAHAN